MSIFVVKSLRFYVKARLRLLNVINLFIVSIYMRRKDRIFYIVISIDVGIR